MPSELSQRISSITSSLECGDGGVRGDLDTALGEVDALVAEVERLRRERDEARAASVERARLLEIAHNEVCDLTAEVERLREINRELVDTHNQHVVTISRLRDALDRYSGKTAEGSSDA